MGEIRGLLQNQIYEGHTTDTWYLSPGSHDILIKNCRIPGGSYLRGAKNITFEDCDIGGAPGAPLRAEFQVGAAYKSPIISENIKFHRCRFHDMVRVDAVLDSQGHVIGGSSHHQAIGFWEVSGIMIEDCEFDRIDGNTAELFFSGGLQNPQMTTKVKLLNNRFAGPIAGYYSLSYNDGGGSMTDHYLNNNLFQSKSPGWGTLSKMVSQFIVDTNYGVCSQGQHDALTKRGGAFKVYPFLSGSSWKTADINQQAIDKIVTLMGGSDKSVPLKVHTDTDLQIAIDEISTILERIRYEL